MEAEPIAEMQQPVDTLMVAGGHGFLAARTDRGLIEHIQRMARRSRRVASVCSGTFVLAEAGLVDGKLVTTHWAAAPYLAEWYPSVTVEPDRIYVRDGEVWSSAGVTAGIDLTLAMVAEDLGDALANEIARGIVLPVRRSGGQSQYSAQLAARGSSSPQLAPLLAWMATNLDSDLSVAALADRIGWGERHTASSNAAWRPRPRSTVDLSRLRAEAATARLYPSVSDRARSTPRGAAPRHRWRWNRRARCALSSPPAARTAAPRSNR